MALFHGFLRFWLYTPLGFSKTPLFLRVFRGFLRVLEVILGGF
jgi:hypothetical protein